VDFKLHHVLKREGGTVPAGLKKLCRVGLWTDSERRASERTQRAWT
jgi:hypothetical protein